MYSTIYVYKNLKFNIFFALLKVTTIFKTHYYLFKNLILLIQLNRQYETF